MQKAQGSMEFLLILGGVLLVAVLVIATLIGIAGPAGTQAEQGTIDLFCSRKPLAICFGETVTVQGTNYTCAIDSTFTKCVWDATPGSGPFMPTNVQGNLEHTYYCYPGGQSVNPIKIATDFTGNADLGGKLYFSLPDNIPAGSTINSATLELYQNGVSGTCTIIDTLYFYKGTNQNCQTSYNNTPDSGPPINPADTDTPNPSCSNVTMTFDIKNTIPAGPGSQDIYIEIRGSDAGGGNHYRQFDHADPTNKPKLTINYSPPVNPQ